MSFERFWMVLAVALPTIAALIAPLPTVDLTYHLRAGGEIIDARAIPAVDTWTFTAAGLPWLDQQWGAQVVLAVVERLGGWTGLVVVRGALTAVIFGAVLAIGLRRGLAARTAALLTLASFIVASPGLALRPQLLGLACFAAVLLIVTARRERPRAMWLVPVVVALWANVHGTFVLAFVVLGLAWLEDQADRAERRHRAAIVGVVAAVAACLTPFGPVVWSYAIGLSANPEVTARITEWQPTTVRDVGGVLFFGSAMAIVVLIARRWAATPWPVLAWLAAFFVLGLYTQRGIAWWAVASVVPVSALLPRATAADPARATPVAVRRINGVIVAVLAVVAILAVPWWRPTDAGTGAPVGTLAYAPPGITARLAQIAGPGDRLFDPQPWGSWFEYALPALPVAIDSRIELFPAEVWDEYDAVIAGTTDWEAILEDWQVTLVVVRTADGDALTQRLVAAGWEVDYADGDGSILRRS